MRLARLDLVRYGKFTERTLDFGSPRPGRPDLHLVYGPNEAGKSTALSAYLDLLFGIARDSSYAFLHPYATMRIGARLELGSGAVEVVRIKRQSATLLDPAGRALDDGLIAGELGGLDREAYEAMFSLDDDTIEKGGEAILASRGDLGQLLFSGSAGTAGLAAALAKMREDVDKLFRPNTNRTELGALRQRLDDLREERTTVDTQAAAFRQLRAEREAAEADYAAAVRARGETEAKADALGRKLAALPRLASLAAARAAMEPLADLPHPPAAWMAELDRLMEREVASATELRALAREIAGLEAELAAVAADPETLRLAPAIDALDQARVAALSAARDLPRRRIDLRSAEAVIEDGLRRLGQPGLTWDRASLPAARVAVLRDLIAARSGLVERREAARTEVARAEREHATARSALENLGGAPGPGVQALGETLASLREGDHGLRLREGERRSVESTAALVEALGALRPWRGDAAALADLPCPEIATVEAWAMALREAEADERRHLDQAEALETRCAALMAEVDALGRLAGMVDEAEARAIRIARDAAWAEHRARLDAGSAAAFEAALRRDDAVAAQRYHQAGEVARIKETSLKLAEAEVELRRARERQAEAVQRAREIKSDVTRAVAAFGADRPIATGPAALAAWLMKREQALTLWRQCLAAERSLAEVRHEHARLRDRLAAALRAAGVAHEASDGFDDLLTRARDALARGEAAARQAERAAELGLALATRRAALAEAEQAEARWHRRWDEARAGTWLAEAEDAASPAAVAEILRILEEMAPDRKARADLVHRVAAMEADEETFARAVAPIAAALGLDPAGPPLDNDREICARVARARADEERRRAVEEKLDEARRRDAAARDEADRIAERARRMSSFFGVESLAEVRERLRACERRDALAATIADLEHEIRTTLRTDDLAAAEAALAGLDVAAAEAERHALESDSAARDASVQALYARLAAAETRLAAIGGDEAAARIEMRRRHALLEIEDLAARYLRLATGIVATERALALYRDRHRSAMLEAASQAFRTLTRGAYRGLATQPGERGGEVLIALPSSGDSKMAADLSKGTRFQLYLALRAAGYHAFATARRPVPFIADDIMETFDDDRAEEAFRLLAAMARTGQVIYLTHHRHLIDVAARACPELSLHRLDA